MHHLGSMRLRQNHSILGCTVRIHASFPHLPGYLSQPSQPSSKGATIIDRIPGSSVVLLNYLTEPRQMT